MSPTCTLSTERDVTYVSELPREVAADYLARNHSCAISEVALDLKVNQTQSMQIDLNSRSLVWPGGIKFMDVVNPDPSIIKNSGINYQPLPAHLIQRYANIEETFIGLRHRELNRGYSEGIESAISQAIVVSREVGSNADVIYIYERDKQKADLVNGYVIKIDRESTKQFLSILQGQSSLTLEQIQRLDREEVVFLDVAKAVALEGVNRALYELKGSNGFLGAEREIAIVDQMAHILKQAATSFLEKYGDGGRASIARADLKFCSWLLQCLGCSAEEKANLLNQISNNLKSAHGTDQKLVAALSVLGRVLLKYAGKEPFTEVNSPRRQNVISSAFAKLVNDKTSGFSDLFRQAHFSLTQSTNWASNTDLSIPSQNKLSNSDFTTPAWSRVNPFENEKFTEAKITGQRRIQAAVRNQEIVQALSKKLSEREKLLIATGVNVSSPTRPAGLRHGPSETLLASTRVASISVQPALTFKGEVLLKISSIGRVVSDGFWKLIHVGIKSKTLQGSTKGNTEINIVPIKRESIVGFSGNSKLTKNSLLVVASNLLNQVIVEGRQILTSSKLKVLRFIASLSSLKPLTRSVVLLNGIGRATGRKSNQLENNVVSKAPMSKQHVKKELSALKVSVSQEIRILDNKQRGRQRNESHSSARVGSDLVMRKIVAQQIERSAKQRVRATTSHLMQSPVVESLEQHTGQQVRVTNSIEVKPNLEQSKASGQADIQTRSKSSKHLRRQRVIRYLRHYSSRYQIDLHTLFNQNKRLFKKRYYLESLLFQILQELGLSAQERESVIRSLAISDVELAVIKKLKGRLQLQRDTALNERILINQKGDQREFSSNLNS